MRLFYFSKSGADEKRLGDFIKRQSRQAGLPAGPCLSGRQEAGAEFLQSPEWGSFLESSGEEIIRVGVSAGDTKDRDSDKILLAATLSKKKIFRNYFYWYSPRGPIVAEGSEPDFYNSVLKFFFEEVKKIDGRALFLRFEPLRFDATEFSARFKDTGFNFRKTISLQPAKTLLLDLNKSEEELLKGMHQKTRYNIRLAQKKGVIIKEGGNDLTDLKEFWRLLKTTGERDNFRLHSFSHYEKLLAVNNRESACLLPSGPCLSGRQEAGPDRQACLPGRQGFIKLFFAQDAGKNIATGIFAFYGDKATYLHGASDNKFRNLMAPYLLQWSLIKYAREKNYKYYDFYGIDEKKWPGVTRFKLGFSGRIFDYPGTYDLVFKSFFYRLYELIRKLRRLIG